MVAARKRKTRKKPSLNLRGVSAPRLAEVLFGCARLLEFLETSSLEQAAHRRQLAAHILAIKPIHIGPRDDVRLAISDAVGDVCSNSPESAARALSFAVRNGLQRLATPQYIALLDLLVDAGVPNGEMLSNLAAQALRFDKAALENCAEKLIYLTAYDSGPLAALTQVETLRSRGLADFDCACAALRMCADLEPSALADALRRLEPELSNETLASEWPAVVSELISRSSIRHVLNALMTFDPRSYTWMMRGVFSAAGEERAVFAVSRDLENRIIVDVRGETLDLASVAARIPIEQRVQQWPRLLHIALKLSSHVSSAGILGSLAKVLDDSSLLSGLQKEALAEGLVKFHAGVVRTREVSDA